MVQRTHNAIVYLRNQSAKDKQQKKQNMPNYSNNDILMHRQA